MSQKQNHKRWRKQFNEDCLKRDKYKWVKSLIDQGNFNF